MWVSPSQATPSQPPPRKKNLRSHNAKSRSTYRRVRHHAFVTAVVDPRPDRWPHDTLHEQLKQAREREYVAAWREDYAAVKAKRDATAQMLRERYPAIVDELVTLMTNIAIIDKEVSRINLAAPYGDHPRLRGTELTARGLDRFMQPEVSIPQELRLPTFHRDNGPVLAWPPRVPSLAETYVLPPAFLVPVDVEQERLEANRRRHEENARLDALYEKREREAAQRREAELREAAGRP